MDRATVNGCTDRSRFRLRGSFPFVVIIVGLLITFFLTAWTAWQGKCATYDEPYHFMGAWLQRHYNDFRFDPENLPLWRYYAMIGTSKNELRIQTSGLLWDELLRKNDTSALFYKNVFYFTAGNDPDAMIGRVRFSGEPLISMGKGVGPISVP